MQSVKKLDFRARRENKILIFNDLVDIWGAAVYAIRKKIISLIDILKKGNSVQ